MHKKKLTLLSLINLFSTDEEIKKAKAVGVSF